MFCCALLCVPSSFAIILMGKRELVALLCFTFLTKPFCRGGGGGSCFSDCCFVVVVVIIVVVVVVFFFFSSKFTPWK